MLNKPWPLPQRARETPPPSKSPSTAISALFLRVLSASELHRCLIYQGKENFSVCKYRKLSDTRP